MIADTIPQDINLEKENIRKSCFNFVYHLLCTISYFNDLKCVCPPQHPHTDLIFLSGELVLQFKLLCLQLVHPLPQLRGFVPERHKILLCRPIVVHLKFPFRMNKAYFHRNNVFCGIFMSLHLLELILV